MVETKSAAMFHGGAELLLQRGANGPAIDLHARTGDEPRFV
jgi:hypothetical protein